MKMRPGKKPRAQIEDKKIAPFRADIASLIEAAAYENSAEINAGRMTIIKVTAMMPESMTPARPINSRIRMKVQVSLSPIWGMLEIE